VVRDVNLEHFKNKVRRRTWPQL